jgi:hypothetical protein
LTSAVFRLGLLTVTLYENDDFTNFKYSFKVPRLDLDFDENLHIFFKDRDQQYSLVIHGMIRVDFSNMYNFTVSSNKDAQVYVDQRLVLDKPQGVKDMLSFQREMSQHELLHLEVRIADREREFEARGERGFFRMYEECGNFKQRLIKPKNIF